MTPRRRAVRRIFDGTAYDTDTAELIVERGGHEHTPENVGRLYRTRNGAYFLWAQYLTPGYRVAKDITPFSDEQAKKWLEANANELVEKYFGRMPEAGAAERRLTLRLPNNLARRLETLASARDISMNLYIVRCLERCAAQDGQPVIPV